MPGKFVSSSGRSSQSTPCACPEAQASNAFHLLEEDEVEELGEIAEEEEETAFKGK